MGKQIEDFLDKEEKKLTSRETFNNNVEKFGFLYVKNENKKTQKSCYHRARVVGKVIDG
jgi:hypothetical protein